MNKATNDPLLTPIITDRIASLIPLESCANALMVCRQWRDSVERIRLDPHREHVAELSLALRAPAYARRFSPPDGPRVGVLDEISLDAAAHNAVITDYRPEAWFVACGGNGNPRSHRAALRRYGVLCHTINRSGSQAAFGVRYDGILLSGPNHDDGQFTTFCTRPSHPTALAFSGDGLRLVVAGFEADHELLERVTIWDMQTRQCIRTIAQSETGLPFSMALDYTGSMLAIGSDSLVTVWNLSLADGPQTLFSPSIAPDRKEGPGAKVAVSDNGRIVGIAVNCGLYSYRRTSSDAWDLAHIATTPDGIFNFSMSGSGAVMASSPQRGDVTLWNALKVPGFDHRTFRESGKELRSALTPDARCLAVSQRDGSLKIYQMAGERTFFKGMMAGLSRWWATASFFDEVG